MDDQSYTIRIPKRWARTAMIVVVTALIVAPLTAMAAHTFTDVPDSHTFHNDIDWLAAADVTRGCNPAQGNTRFCPDDNVTRGQMAAFLKRLSENQVVDAATAVTAETAETLDGHSASDLQSAALLARRAATVIPGGAITEVLAFELPPGSYLLTGSATVNNNAGSTETVGCTLALGAATVGTTNLPLGPNLTAGEREAWTLQLVAEIDTPAEATITCNTSAGFNGNVLQPQISAISVQTATASVLSQQDIGNEDG